MTILIVVGAIAAVYLLIAAVVYFWVMGRSPNAMQKSLSGMVKLMALAWPLGLVLWALSEVDKKHDQ
jgi:high-affinity Fe2+/Pb2+ permease